MNRTLNKVLKNHPSDTDNILPNWAWGILLSLKNNRAQDATHLTSVILKFKPHPKSIPTTGFTLVELLITISIFVFLLIIAAPAYQTMIMNNRMTADSDSLVNALNYARSTALYEAINVVVCPLGAINSSACGANWSNGWIVVTQPVSGDGTLLKSQQLTSTGPVLSSTAASVVFDAHGIATTQSNFKLCDNRGGAFARSLQVLTTGFVQSGNTPGQAIWDNSALGCP